ncbi:MAG: septum formation initiator family protein [Treponema sp.]|jgi:cell division protein FtsB|nr:septum formation initiator family protein [Treponema sp.]
MYFIKYLVPLWIGICIYVICSVFTGPTGLSAYEQLRVEQEKLKVNMENLRRLNTELENTGNALVHDFDTIAMYARELGYGDSNERFIRIVGLEKPQKQRTDPGQILLAAKPEHTSNGAIFTFAFLVALVALLCVLIPDLFHINHATAQNMHGTARKKVREQWHRIFS